MIGIYINNEKLDMYKDETVKYKGKLVDSQDISKLFADSTDAFTVPASKRNNKIFRNWFEIGVKNGYNSNKRQPAYIEVKTHPYKTGLIELENVSYKKGKPVSYKITFYGDLLTLSDKFDDTKLKDLDLDKYNFEYNISNLTNLLYFNYQLNNGNFNLPFLSITDKNFTYNDGSVDDIAADNPLEISTLRPGIKEKELINLIEDKFDIRFESDLFKLPAFQKSYLWLNKNEDANEMLNWKTFKFDDNSFIGQDNNNDFSLSSNKEVIQIKRDNQYVLDNLGGDFPLDREMSWYIVFKFNISVNNQNTEYRVRLVDDDTGTVVYQEDEFQAGDRIILENTSFKFIPLNAGDRITRSNYRLELKSKGKLNYTIATNFKSVVGREPFWLVVIMDVLNDSLNENVVSDFVIKDNMPDLSISEYFKDLLNKYKLVIIPDGKRIDNSDGLSANSKGKEVDVYKLITINNFYDEGNTIDLSNKIDLNEHEAKNKKVYKKIEFKQEQSDLTLQKQFRDANDRDYGNYVKLNESDGDKKEVELKQSNLMITILKDMDNDRNVSIGLMSELNDNVLEPSTEGIFFYFHNGIDYLVKPINISFSGSILSFDKAPVTGTSNSKYLEQITQTTNWFNEADIYQGGQDVGYGYYNNYWKRWVEHNLEMDNRTVDFSGVLSLEDLNKLNLNTEIIVGNNAYSIDEFDIDLTTLEVDFKLYPSMKREFEYFENKVFPKIILNDYDVSYEQINIEIRDKWKVEKIDTGDGIDWVSFLSESNGKGKKEFPIKINGDSAASDRSMIIKVTDTKNGVEYEVKVNQVTS